MLSRMACEWALLRMSDQEVIRTGLKNARVNDLQRVVGLVTQDDVLLGRCTVQEVLWFSACLRLPARMARTP